MKKLCSALVIISLFTFAIFANYGCSSSGSVVDNSCGVVIDGELEEDPEDDQGELVTVTGFLNGNVVTVRESDDESLTTVVLHGLGPLTNNEAQLAAANDFLAQFVGREGVFFAAIDDCFTNSGGLQRLSPGQIFLDDGTNISEELLIRGLAEISRSNECRSNLIRGCQQGLLIEAELVEN